MEGIAACIEDLKTKKVDYRNQVVLCRTNKRLNEIASGLEARGIPVLHLGSLFEREEIRDLLALLSLAIDPFGDALVRVGAMPRYALTLQDVYQISKTIRTDDVSTLEGLAAVAPINPICRRNPSIPGLCRIASPTCARPFELSLPWSVRLSSAARRCILRTLPCDSSLPP